MNELSYQYEVVVEDLRLLPQELRRREVVANRRDQRCDARRRNRRDGECETDGRVATQREKEDRREKVVDELRSDVPKVNSNVIICIRKIFKFLTN